MGILRYNFTLRAHVNLLVVNLGEHLRTVHRHPNRARALIHSSLQGVAFPPKHIVCVLTKAGANSKFSKRQMYYANQYAHGSP